MGARLKHVFLAFAVVSCGACSDANSPSDAGNTRMDGDVLADAGGAQDSGGSDDWVEIGTGEVDFAPLTEGETVELQRGPQGGDRYFGFHVWVGVRARGFSPTNVRARFSATLSDNATSVSEPSSYTLDLNQNGEVFEFAGLRSVFNDCCQVEGESIVLRIDVTDVNGVVRSDSRRVMMPAECPRGLPNPAIDPCP